MNTSSIPTITKRPAEARGQADHGWLQARFTFSFADYLDPDHMGFRSLRVINNDTIQPGGGFPKHPHDNMEIFTYVIEGQLEHRDSMGNGAIIEAGNLQYMSAASGVTHSEFNPSSEKVTQLYQVWLHPNEMGGEPRYAEKLLGESAQPNALTLLFSGDGREGSTKIRQNAEISFGRVKVDQEIVIPASDSKPHAWVQVISGAVSVLEKSLETGDGLAVENSTQDIPIRGTCSESRLLAFRLS